jgi:hypothetical protein
MGVGADAPAELAATHAGDSRRYEAPRIVALGSLADLTAGGAVSEDDGFGGAGASGVL